MDELELAAHRRPTRRYALRVGEGGGRRTVGLEQPGSSGSLRSRILRSRVLRCGAATLCALTLVACGASRASVHERVARHAAKPLTKRDAGAATPPPSRGLADLPLAYEALAKHGLTDETRRLFRGMFGPDAEPPEAPRAETLHGVLSDDGSVVLLFYRPLNAIYVADAATGNVRRRWWGNLTGSIADDPFLPGTRSVIFGEEPMHSSRGPDELVVRDALTGVDDSVVADSVISWLRVGSRVAYEHGGRLVPEDGRVDVVDIGPRGVSSKLIDSFPVEFALIEQFAGNLVFAAGLGPGSSKVLRDISRGRDLFRAAGDCVVSSSLSPDGRYFALATRAVVPAAPCEEALRLFDVTKAEEVARSTACSAPTKPSFDPAGHRVVVSSRTQACVEAIPSLRLLTRTEPLPQRAVPDPRGDEVWRSLLCEDAVCMDTTSGRALLASALSGRISWMGEGMEWVDRDQTGSVLPSLPGSPTGRLLHARETDRAFTVDAKHRLVDLGPMVFERPASDDPAPLREALERVAAHTCLWRGALLPIEVCR